MIRRVYAPLTLSRKDAVAQAKRDLRKVYRVVIFQASGKKDATLRWLEFEVT